MEELACVGAVNADFVDLGGILAEVFDVAENVSAGVLGDEIAAVDVSGCLLKG